MSKTIHPKLKTLIPLVDGIAETFGKNCEVVLHDFSNLKNSIIKIKNGHVTGRHEDSPMTELSLNKVREGNVDSDIINYSGKSADGRHLKSSTMFIRDEDGEPIGCLCINIDLTDFVATKNLLNDFMKIDTDKAEVAEEENQNKVNIVLSDLVTDALDELGKPTAYLAKEDKVKIVETLDSQGAFLIKGAIDYVADFLSVSKYTIYNYLDEIKGDD